MRTSLECPYTPGLRVLPVSALAVWHEVSVAGGELCGSETVTQAAIMRLFLRIGKVREDFPTGRIVQVSTEMFCKKCSFVLSQNTKAVISFSSARLAEEDAAMVLRALPSCLAGPGAHGGPGSETPELGAASGLPLLPLCLWKSLLRTVGQCVAGSAVAKQGWRWLWSSWVRATNRWVRGAWAVAPRGPPPWCCLGSKAQVPPGRPGVAPGLAAWRRAGWPVLLPCGWGHGSGRAPYGAVRAARSPLCCPGRPGFQAAPLRGHPTRWGPCRSASLGGVPALGVATAVCLSPDMKAPGRGLAFQ